MKCGDSILFSFKSSVNHWFKLLFHLYTNTDTSKGNTELISGMQNYACSIIQMGFRKKLVDLFKSVSHVNH